MNETLEAWNKADDAIALDAMIACCGAKNWALAMVDLRPIDSIVELSEAADRVWSTMELADWMESFAGHPRIGERKSARPRMPLKDRKLGRNRSRPRQQTRRRR